MFASMGVCNLKYLPIFYSQPSHSARTLQKITTGQLINWKVADQIKKVNINILITDLINALRYDFHTSLKMTFEIIQQR